MCTHLHSFERPVLGQLAKDSQGTDSWLTEGMGACCSINEPSIKHTQRDRANTGNRRPYPLYHLKESHQSAGSSSRPFSMAKFLSTALSCGVLIRAAITLPCTLSEELCASYTVCCTAKVICYPN